MSISHILIQYTQSQYSPSAHSARSQCVPWPDATVVFLRSPPRTGRNRRLSSVFSAPQRAHHRERAVQRARGTGSERHRGRAAQRARGTESTQHRSSQHRSARHEERAVQQRAVQERSAVRTRSTRAHGARACSARARSTIARMSPSRAARRNRRLFVARIGKKSSYRAQRPKLIPLLSSSSTCMPLFELSVHAALSSSARMPLSSSARIAPYRYRAHRAYRSYRAAQRACRYSSSAYMPLYPAQRACRSPAQRA